MNRSPLLIVAVYLSLHIIISVGAVLNSSGGGKDFEVAVKGFSYLIYALPWVSIVATLACWKWAVRNRLAAGVLLAFALLITIKLFLFPANPDGAWP